MYNSEWKTAWGMDFLKYIIHNFFDHSLKSLKLGSSSSSSMDQVLIKFTMAKDWSCGRISLPGYYFVGH